MVQARSVQRCTDKTGRASRANGGTIVETPRCQSNCSKAWERSASTGCQSNCSALPIALLFDRPCSRPLHPRCPRQDHTSTRRGVSAGPLAQPTHHAPSSAGFVQYGALCMPQDLLLDVTCAGEWTDEFVRSRRPHTRVCDRRHKTRAPPPSQGNRRRPLSQSPSLCTHTRVCAW